MLTEWPNRLGYDAEDAEIWKHPSAFRVFTRARVLLVPYSVTDNPETALSLCREQGLSRAALDEMDPRDAEAAFQRTRPLQVEMF